MAGCQSDASGAVIDGTGLALGRSSVSEAGWGVTLSTVEPGQNVVIGGVALGTSLSIRAVATAGNGTQLAEEGRQVESVPVGGVADLAGRQVGAGRAVRDRAQVAEVISCVIKVLGGFIAK